MIRVTKHLALLRHTLTQAVLVMLGAFVIFRFGIRPPIPANLLWFYMAITLGVVLVFVSFDDQSWKEFRTPILTLLLERESRRRILARRAFLALIPLLAGYIALARTIAGVQAPAELRAIHPAPPTSITVHEEQIELQEAINPFWPDPSVAPALEVLQEGGEIYAANCVYCHGDALDGEGVFKEGLNPPPANFMDVGTIAQLQQSYLLWRIAKGGVGLPRESSPWASSMPAWEESLSLDEMWKVIAYLYHQTGHSPRTWEE